VIELQAGGAFYSWRLPPPTRLGGGVAIEAHKKLVRGTVLTPRETRRATLCNAPVPNMAQFYSHVE
jgi:hypothetical protein